MSMPVNPVLGALARRVLENLAFVEEHAPPWKPGDPSSDDAPFADTQLLISLLGVLVFPHERTPDALGEILEDYDGQLDQIIDVKYIADQNGQITIAGVGGANERIDPRSIKSLPRLLRNSIAHFHILPIGVDGRFAGIRIWNARGNGAITFVADLYFDAFRPLAEHILRNLGDREGVKFSDPPDPLEQLKDEGKL